MTAIPTDFFDRDIHVVARDLLGRDLVRETDGTLRSGRIVEVEVYEGSNDRASHARTGTPTARTAPMFADPGTLYVYTIYGIHQCLNLRAPSEIGPGAILIRACQPLQGLAAMAQSRGLATVREKRLLRGPAMICQALHLGPEHSGLLIGDLLALHQGSPVASDQVHRTPRIGLNRETCGTCTDRPWRYTVKDSPWLSR